jgi:hypothetical protein
MRHEPALATHYIAWGDKAEKHATLSKRVNQAEVDERYIGRYGCTVADEAEGDIMKACPALCQYLQIGEIAALVFSVSVSTERAESVFVKYRGEVDLRSFDCEDFT